MNGVKDVLHHIGFTELRNEKTGEWKPLDAVNGRFGTTDDTHLILPQSEEDVCRLVDPENEEQLATARKGQGRLKNKEGES